MSLRFGDFQFKKGDPHVSNVLTIKILNFLGVGESESEVVSPHTPRHHVTSTHFVWRWHVTPEKQHFVTGKGHNDHLTTL